MSSAPFDFSLSADLPILHCTINDSFHFREHLRQTNEQLTEAVSGAQRPVYLLVDVRELHMGWSELLDALASIRDVRANQTQRPNTLGLLVISANDIIKLGAKALGQRQYASTSPVLVFDGVEDAYAYVQKSVSA